MKPQEVITIITEMSISNSPDNSSLVKAHPELDQFFEKGMYIEKLVQSCLENGKCAITFVFRHYNPSQSRNS
jgi:3'-phosphoadenosine 5'-phosphosulfate sulfotransferase